MASVVACQLLRSRVFRLYISGNQLNSLLCRGIFAGHMLKFSLFPIIKKQGGNVSAVTQQMSDDPFLDVELEMMKTMPWLSVSDCMFATFTLT